MKLWENYKIRSINRLEPRSYFNSYLSIEEALTYERSLSLGYKLLNGVWKFSFFEAPEYSPSMFWAEDFKDDEWNDIIVPSPWEIWGYGKPYYTDLIYLFPLNPPLVPTENPTGIYRRKFYYEYSDENRVIIRFNGVSSAFSLWINGQEVGYSKGSRFTSEFDITDYIKQGENLIVLRVYKFSDGSYLEDQDMWSLGGITRDVEIYQIPKSCIWDYFIIPELVDNYTKGFLNMRIKFNLMEQDDYLFCYKIFDDDYNIVLEDEMKIYGKDINIYTKPIQVNSWSDENPYLYNLVLILKKGKKILQVIPQKIGFRKIEIKNNILLLNGKKIKLRGINRHEFYPNLGYYTTPEITEMDIKLLKKNNINAIRTAHYPNSPFFYDLCDKYGIYVISECDLETHGFIYSDCDYIANDKEWEESFVDRAERMVHRDKNHTSIIAWSLGNESGFGRNFVKMKEVIQQIDISRPIHYEGDKNGTIVDIYSTMYTWLEPEKPGDTSLEEILSNSNKPYILCEFGHSMGTGPGGIKEYCDLLYKYDNFLGLFIWEFSDHGLSIKGHKDYYIYGGDLGEEPNDGNFCIDGILLPDRTVKSGLDELKKQYSPIRINLIDLLENKIRISVENRFKFISLDCFDMVYSFFADGILIDSGYINLKGIKPEEKKEIYIDFNINEKLKIYKEIFLNLEIVLNKDLFWAERGHIIVKEQFKLNYNFSNLKRENMRLKNSIKNCKVIENLNNIVFIGNDFEVFFDKVKAKITEVKRNGLNFINYGPIFNLWRPPIDNDKNLIADYKYKYHLNLISERVDNVLIDKDKNLLRLKVYSTYGTPNSSWFYRLNYDYLIYSDGDMMIKIIGTLDGDLSKIPEMLPKIGFKWFLNKNLINVSWYGRGPKISYPDMKDSQLIGIYKAKVYDLFEFQIKPQDSANRSDCRWVSLYDYWGNSIMFGSEKYFNFSAYVYDEKDIEVKRHFWDLTPLNYIIFNIDYKQNALGTNSCGQNQLKKYRCIPENFEFVYFISCFNKLEINEMNKYYIVLRKI